MEAQKKISLTMDDKEILVPEGITVLEAARQNGVHIPTLCHHEALTPWGGCRLCLVEIDGAPKLAASCVTPVRPGMEVVTRNERIIEARRTILEFMFAERNHYCMFCAQSGDCELQSLAYEYQVDHLSVPPLEGDFPTDTSHPDLVIDHNRCVLCGRCVRACRELAGNSVLDFHNRGGNTLIGADLSQGLGDSTCTSCGLCMQVCPTGAIFSRYRTHYAVQGKAKTWQAVSSWCPQCGRLCPAIYQVKDNNLLKVEAPLPGREPERGQLCRRGRFDLLKIGLPRLEHPMVRGSGGQWLRATLDEALEFASSGLGLAKEPILGLASSACSGEDLGGFKSLMAQCPAGSRLDTLDGGDYRALTRAARGLSPAWQEPAWDNLSRADLILEMGADIGKTHPMIRSLTRRAVFENRARLVVINRENQTGVEEALHLPAEGPGLVACLLRLLTRLQDGVESAGAKIAGTTASKESQLAALWQKARHPVIITGPGLNGGKESKALEAAMALAKTKLEPGKAWPLIILKAAGNSAGAWQLGMASTQAPDGLERYRAGLLMLAEDEWPDYGWPEQLAGLDFLVAITPYFRPELAGLAKVLLPRPTWLESKGTYANSDGSESRTLEQVLEPPPEVPPTVDTLAALAGKVRRVAPA